MCFCSIEICKNAGFRLAKYCSISTVIGENNNVAQMTNIYTQTLYKHVYVRIITLSCRLFLRLEINHSSTGMHIVLDKVYVYILVCTVFIY